MWVILGECSIISSGGRCVGHYFGWVEVIGGGWSVILGGGGG